MRLIRFIPVFAGLAIMALALTGCLNEDNKIPPNCYDGELNNDETDIDCGGPNCPECPPSCFNGVWDVFPLQGWVEEDVDCGGPCPACPSCTDNVLNGDETGIDCGGLECPPCPGGAGDCTNNIIDGDETGVDCGGCCCPDCPGGGDCTNGEQDGDETGVDCGGAACPPCGGGGGGMQFTVPGEGVLTFSTALATFNGDDLVISGTDVANGSISFTIPEPMAGWVNGLNVTFDPNTAPTQNAVYIPDILAGDMYTSDYVGASISMTILNINAVAGGNVSGTFSGTLKFEVDGTTLQVQSGVFNVSIL